MKKVKRNPIFFTIILLGIIFFNCQSVSAYYQRETEVKVYTSGPNPSLYKSYKPYQSNYLGGADIDLGDFGNDGREEVVLGKGPGESPEVTILDGNGNEINSFLAYDSNFNRGINVAVCDLDNDGVSEIITGTRYGGGPQVRTFDGYGQAKFSPGWFAYDQNFRGGVNVACGDLNGDGRNEIITGAGPGGGPHVRVFDRFGNFTGMGFFPFDQSFRGGVVVATANFDGGVEDELITARQSYGQSQVVTYKTYPAQYVIGDFLGFPDTFLGGVNISGGDIDHDGLDEVVVFANAGGGPHIRSFEGYGKYTGIQLFAYENDFRGGTNVALGDIDGGGLPEIFVTPNSKVLEGRTDLFKYIDIDISDQLLKYFENGFKIGEYQISTGKISMPTPLGEFQIMNKSLDAYSAKYGLWMPWWMQITSAGHGLHGLPYWKLGGGGVYKEGENHLGLRVSHGCVRLPWAGAEKLYQWAASGTTVIIHE